MKDVEDIFRKRDPLDGCQCRRMKERWSRENRSATEMPQKFGVQDRERDYGRMHRYMFIIC